MQYELKSEITALKTPIEFPCLVGDEEMTAIVTHVEDAFVQTLYHVTFSDGHKDVYAPVDDEAMELWGRDWKPDQYTAAILNDISILPLLADGEGYSYILLQAKKDERFFNLWIHPGNENNKYSVYYNGEYHFTLHKEGEWKLMSMREKEYEADAELAHLVSNHLVALYTLSE